LHISDRGTLLQEQSPATSGKAPFNPSLLMLLGIAHAALRPVPLPDEPVGLGAVWELHRPFQFGNLHGTTLSRYKLTARAGDELRLAMQLRQSLVPQQLGGAASAELISLLSHQLDATGFALLNLTSPMANEAYAELSAATVFDRIAADRRDSVREQQSGVLRMHSERRRASARRGASASAAATTSMPPIPWNAEKFLAEYAIIR
jgi:hypothetical protein